jgi:hypothetical protein
MASIQDLEAALDARLPAERLSGAAPAALIEAARAWSDAVWADARARGAPDLPPDVVRRGREIAGRPIFICGAHRSGTTLVRDLLDSHPALSVLPAEGTFHTNLANQLAGKPDADRLAVMAGEWLRRLVNPINRPPYWLLGRTEAAQSPYVTFARTLAAWWSDGGPTRGAAHPSWPLVAVALAYASTTGRLDGPGVRHWVEKTPANEPFLDRLEAEFPALVVVHVIRHPFAVLASRKQLEVAATHGFAQFHRALEDLARSYRMAVQRAAGQTRYCLVRYEDLVADPAAATHALAGALDIEWTPSLLQPTVAGRPASTNSAAMASDERGVILPAPDLTNALTPSERDRVVAALGADATTLGYALPAVGAIRGRLLSLGRALRPQR